MEDFWPFIVGGLLTALVSFGLGRWLGAVWVALFVVVMLASGAMLWIAADQATGQYAGLGEMVLFFLIWLPVAVSGLIGGVIGWGVRVIARRPLNPPPLP